MFALQQIPKWVKMEANAARKFPESAFGFTMYTIAWLWSLYIVLTDPRGLFTNLAAHWSGTLGEYRGCYGNQMNTLTSVNGARYTESLVGVMSLALFSLTSN